MWVLYCINLIQVKVKVNHDIPMQTLKGQLQPVYSHGIRSGCIDVEKEWMSYWKRANVVINLRVREIVEYNDHLRDYQILQNYFFH
jgi:hypothetical protein